MHFPLISWAWMPGHFKILFIVAIATMTATSLRAQSPAATESEPASTSNQSLSLEAAGRCAGGKNDGTPDPARRTAGAPSNDDHAHQEDSSSLLLPPRANAVRNQSSDETAAVTGPVDIKSLAALVLVLALMVAIVFALRRFVPSLRAGDHTALRVVARAGLSSKHSLALVRLGRRYLLLGLGGDGVACLCEIDNAEETAELAAHFGRPDRPLKDFEKLLESELGEHRPPRRVASVQARVKSNEESTEALVGLRSKLRALKTG